MKEKGAHTISSLTLPPQLDPFIAEFSVRLLEAADAGRIDDEAGTVDVGDLPEQLQPSYLVYLLAGEFNEIIEHLNLVLLDLSLLGERLEMFRGSPVQRYRLLVRVFMYEYFRFREMARIGIDALRTQKLITDDTAAQMRGTLDQFFRPMVRVRNTLVHDSPPLIGKDHSMLWLAAQAEEVGVRFEELTVQGALDRVCKERLEFFTSVGAKAVRVLQAFIDGMAQSFCVSDN